MSKDKNFEYLGTTFQLQLLNQIVLDRNFGNSILEVLEPTYFENKYFRIIIQMIREYYKKYEHTPSYDTLEQITKSEFSQETTCKIILDTIEKIKIHQLMDTSLFKKKH